MSNHLFWKHDWVIKNGESLKCRRCIMFMAFVTFSAYYDVMSWDTFSHTLAHIYVNKWKSYLNDKLLHCKKTMGFIVNTLFIPDPKHNSMYILYNKSNHRFSERLTDNLSKYDDFNDMVINWKVAESLPWYNLLKKERNLKRF